MHELGSVNLDQILKVEVSKVQAPSQAEKKQKKVDLNYSMNLDNTFNSSLNMSICENIKNRTFYVFKVFNSIHFTAGVVQRVSQGRQAKAKAEIHHFYLCLKNPRGGMGCLFGVPLNEDKLRKLYQQIRQS